MDFGTPNASLSCCLPCPVTHWMYSDGFPLKIRVASGLAILSLLGSTFAFCTTAYLPASQTNQDYMGVRLFACLIMISLAFVIPLGTDPDTCQDAITPNNWHTDASCAVTGSLLILGTTGAAFWSEPTPALSNSYRPLTGLQFSRDRCRPDYESRRTFGPYRNLRRYRKKARECVLEVARSRHV